MRLSELMTYVQGLMTQAHRARVPTHAAGSQVTSDLLESLEQNLLSNEPSLKKIELADQALTDQQVLPIIQTLFKNKIVTDIDLSHNQLGDATGYALLAAVYTNRKLCRIQLEGNSIRARTLDKINARIAKNIADIAREERQFVAVSVRVQRFYALMTEVMPLPDLATIPRQEQRAYLSRILDHTTWDEQESPLKLDTLRDKKALNLSDRRLSISDIDLLKTLLTGTSLHVLSLGGCRIGNDRALSFSEALFDNTSLLALNLEFNDLTSDGIDQLIAILKTNATVQSLNLAHNPIKDARNIAEMLEENTGIIALNLADTQLEDESVIALAEAITHNTTVKKLTLGNRGIGYDSALEIASLLANNKTLQHLNFSDTDIGDQGVLAIKDALRDNTALTHLTLLNNDITDHGANALIELRKTNLTLKVILLDKNNKISPQLLEQIRFENMRRQQQKPMRPPRPKDVSRPPRHPMATPATLLEHSLDFAPDTGRMSRTESPADPEIDISVISHASDGSIVKSIRGVSPVLATPAPTLVKQTASIMTQTSPPLSPAAPISIAPTPLPPPLPPPPSPFVERHTVSTSPMRSPVRTEVIQAAIPATLTSIRIAPSPQPTTLHHSPVLLVTAPVSTKKEAAPTPHYSPVLTLPVVTIRPTPKSVRATTPVIPARAKTPSPIMPSTPLYQPVLVRPEADRMQTPARFIPSPKTSTPVVMPTPKNLSAFFAKAIQSPPPPRVVPAARRSAPPAVSMRAIEAMLARLEKDKDAVIPLEKRIPARTEIHAPEAHLMKKIAAPTTFEAAPAPSVPAPVTTAPAPQQHRQSAPPPLKRLSDGKILTAEEVRREERETQHSMPTAKPVVRRPSAVSAEQVIPAQTRISRRRSTTPTAHCVIEPVKRKEICSSTPTVRATSQPKKSAFFKEKEEIISVRQIYLDNPQPTNNRQPPPRVVRIDLCDEPKEIKIVRIKK